MLLPSSDARRRAASVGFGEVLEFLLVGGASLLLLPLFYWGRMHMGLDEAELLVGFLAFHGALFLNNPHFAATYLLFYRNIRSRVFGTEVTRAQRLRTWIAGVAVPLGLGVWGAFALVDHSASRLGWMIQLMFFLVGWHYVKQGFGVLSILSLRRGVRFERFERGAVLAHCIAAWLFGRTNPPDPGRQAVVDDVLYTSIPHPPGIEKLSSTLFALSTLWLAWVLVRKWKREQHRLPWVPLAGFLITVWLWTAYSRIDPLFIYVIPALHSLQYLYFVALLRKNQARELSGPPAFRPVARSLAVFGAASVALGFLLFRGIPPILDDWLVLHDPLDRLGTTPYLATFGVFLNIHHYFMDAVLWRRENPETRFLVADV